MNSGFDIKCEFCQSKAKRKEVVTCPICGKYILVGKLFDDYNRFKTACLLHETKLKGNDGVIGINCIESEFPYNCNETWKLSEKINDFPDATEVIDRSIVNLSKKVSDPYSFMQFNPVEARYIFFSIHFRQILDYIAQIGFVKERSVDRTDIIMVSITPKGWERIQQISHKNKNSNQAFVAMWFNKDRDIFYDNGIEPAIRGAYFYPKRIDKQPHNNKICDEIVSEIRKSKFLIADVTGQNGGVYFEAGFAMGLGIPVIWLMDKSRWGNPKEGKETLHFDTRQYSHIFYESPEDLREQLKLRILATIGEGTNKTG